MAFDIPDNEPLFEAARDKVVVLTGSCQIKHTILKDFSH